MTTEEIVQGLVAVRKTAAIPCEQQQAIDAAIERLRGDEKAEAGECEWPRVFKSECFTWVMRSEIDGDAYDAGDGSRCESVCTVSGLLNDTPELTGPARAEVLERLGLTKKGSAK